MEINYTRSHNDSFMRIVGEVEPAGYEAKMIASNKISPLLDFSKIEINGVTTYSYNISRRESLEDYLEHQNYSPEAFERIIINLEIALNEIGKYLIEEKHLLLTGDTIFLEKANDSFRVGLCYYPKDNGTVQDQIRSLMEQLIKRVDSHDRELAEFVFGIYEITLAQDYTLEEIKDYILEKRGLNEELEIENVELIDETLESDSYEEKDYEPRETLYDYYPKDERESIKDKLIDWFKGFFEKTKLPSYKDTLMFKDFVVEPEEEIEERTILLKDSMPAGKLVYDGQNNEDNFVITKDVFRIGSSKTNDAVLKSRAVSSTHAKIYRENGEYFLEDLNSLNGSFLGNMGLTYKQRVKLKTMDVIRFADEAFVFM